MKRLAKDQIMVECCISSNQHTGAVRKGAPHPIRTLLEHGVPVSICCDNSTVSRTSQNIECGKAAREIGVDALLRILKDSDRHFHQARNRSGGAGARLIRMNVWLPQTL